MEFFEAARIQRSAVLLTIPSPACAGTTAAADEDGLHK
jgi:hypothetical protein